MRHGINGLVIDPYNEIEHRRPPNMTETEYVSEMLGKVKRFAVNHDVHVWFVAHPVKMQPQNGKMPVPTLYDISGSANWTNKPDVGLVVHPQFRNQSGRNPRPEGPRQIGRPARPGHPRLRQGDRALFRAITGRSRRPRLSGRLRDEGRSSDGRGQKSR
jgi:hypothetical protein